MISSNGEVIRANGNIERLAESVEQIARWGERAPWEGRPPAQPPSCFSELYRLNQCYDDIQAMKEILTKVMTDLIKNDPTITEAIIEAITKVGTTVPQIGVTDGSDAQPGQVGEWRQQVVHGAVTGVQSQSAMVSFTMAPGDWNLWALLTGSVFVNDAQFLLSPEPEGMSDNMGTLTQVTTPANMFIISAASRLSTAVPVVLPFAVSLNATGTSPPGEFDFWLRSRRAR